MQFLQQIIQAGLHLIEIILHLDVFLNQWVTDFGAGIYGILFVIIFSETGLIILPFLPGDSLLFALGALTVVDNAYLRMDFLAVLLIFAAIAGDAVNYFIGRQIGLKLFQNPNSKIFRRQYLDRTSQFYEKHGGKTIILARFIPIIRTFAPFVAGLGRMNYSRFFVFNVVGGATWISLFLLAGKIFGNLPSVKRNFHIVIVAIILISCIPVVIEYWKLKRERLLPLSE